MSEEIKIETNSAANFEISATEANFPETTQHVNIINTTNDSPIHAQTPTVDLQEWLVNFWLQGDLITHIIIATLLLMLTVSWIQIIIKGGHSLRRFRINKILHDFWLQSTVDKAINLLGRKLGKHYSFTELAKSAVDAAHYYDQRKNSGIGKELGRDEFIANNLRQVINRSSGHLESGMTLLISIAIVSPFVGIVGTIYEIHRALLINSDLAAASISGQVGEGLVITAIGMFISIPAILAYKSFGRSNRLELIELESFAHDLHSYLNINTKTKK